MKSGAPALPGMTAKGGTLLGFPAITSAHVPVEAGSPGDGDTSITLLDPAQILVADEGRGNIEVAMEASLQMEDVPVAGATNLVSLYQTHTAALRLTRYLNWVRCRDGMAQVLNSVAY